MADPKSKYVDSGAIARFKEKIVELIVALFDTKMDVDGSNSAEASEIKFGDFDSGTKSTISMKNGVLTLDADEVVKLSEEYVIPDSNNNSLVNKRYVDNAIEDIGLNFFVAEYGKSTFDEVCSAAEEGKAIFMLYAGTLIPCSYEWFGSRPGDGLNLVALVPGYSHKVYSFTVNTEDNWSNSWDNYTTTRELNERLLEKQDVLVSGTNIKTVNGTSLLGEGNVNTARVYGAIRNDTSAEDIIQAIVEGKIISLDNMTQPTVYFRVGEHDVILFFPFVPVSAEVGGVEDIVLSFWHVKGSQWTNYTCNLPDMANYYTKEDVYTKAEVNDAIQAEDTSIKAYVDQVVGDLETRSY